MKRLRFQISSVLRELPNGTAKKYAILYKDAGFEFGFGRGGAYEGHSHLCFVDVLFSPSGVTLAGRSFRSTLVIAPPRTYLPDVETGDFAFLKFCPDDREVVLPDKIPDQMHEQEILSFVERTRLTYSWYAQRSRPGTIRISLWGQALKLDFADQTSFLVSK